LAIRQSNVLYNGKGYTSLKSLQLYQNFKLVVEIGGYILHSNTLEDEQATDWEGQL